MTNDNPKLKALTLRDKGKSYRQIAKELKVSVSTVHAWLNSDDVKTEQEARHQKQLETDTKELSSEVIQKGAKFIIRGLLDNLDGSMASVGKQIHLASIMYVKACRSNNHRRMVDAMRLYMSLESLKINAVMRVYELLSKDAARPIGGIEEVKSVTVEVNLP